MIYAFIVFNFLFLFFTISYADVYKYTDENGIVCYTDAPLNKKAEIAIREKEHSNSSQNAPKTNSKNSLDYHGVIHEKAAKYEVDPSLIKAVIKVESNWNERAISRKGAMGLMQLMPSTAYEMNVLDPFNPDDNIEGGTKYLKYLLNRFDGNINLALAAYNAGPQRVERVGTIPRIQETRQYVNKVLYYYSNGDSVNPSDTTDKRGKNRPEPIYKVVLQDGTTLFTNSPFLIRNNAGL